MLSGDNLVTARECAIKAGIITYEESDKDKVCMTGDQFRDLVGGTRKVRDKDGNEKWEVVNMRNFKSIYPRLKVMARTIPEDKFAFIIGVKDLGETVAMTADGINDAKALKNANIGFCMGISGC